MRRGREGDAWMGCVGWQWMSQAGEGAMDGGKGCCIILFDLCVCVVFTIYCLITASLRQWHCICSGRTN